MTKRKYICLCLLGLACNSTVDSINAFPFVLKVEAKHEDLFCSFAFPCCLFPYVFTLLFHVRGND